MIKYVSYINLLLVALHLSCLDISGQHVSKINELTENSLVYALPQTQLIIEIKGTQTNFHKGVFSGYAEKFLGFQPGIKKDYTVYNITKADIKTVAQTDPEQFFVFSPEKGEVKYDAIEELARKEMIVINPDNNTIINNHENIVQPPTPFENYIAYESLQKDRLDTIFKREFRDSSWVQVPYYQRKYSLKTKEDHARDAANTLINLNYKLLKAMERLDPEDEYNPDVSQALINEAQSLKEKYYKYFNGFITTGTFSFYTVITPVKDEKKYVVANFSEDHGIGEQIKPGNEIEINFESYSSAGLAKIQEKSVQSSNKFTCRIPAKVHFTITYKDTVLSSGFLNISQYGNIVQLPSRMVRGK